MNEGNCRICGVPLDGSCLGGLCQTCEEEIRDYAKSQGIKPENVDLSDYGY